MNQLSVEGVPPAGSGDFPVARTARGAGQPREPAAWKGCPTHDAGLGGTGLRFEADICFRLGGESEQMAVGGDIKDAVSHDGG